MKKLSLIESFKNWKRKLRWNNQYKNGKWDYLFGQDEDPRYAKIIELLERFCVNPKLLDLGAGEGVLRFKLEENNNTFEHYCGIDFSEVSIQKARKFQFANSEFIVADLYYYTPNDLYDGIVLNEAFYYINDRLKEDVLNRILSGLVINGILIVSMFKEGGGCWPYFEKNRQLKNIELTTVYSTKKSRYWKIGVYQKIEV